MIKFKEGTVKKKNSSLSIEPHHPGPKYPAFGIKLKPSSNRQIFSIFSLNILLPARSLPIEAERPMQTRNPQTPAHSRTRVPYPPIFTPIESPCRAYQYNRFSLSELR